MLPKYTSVSVEQAAPVTSFIRLVESLTVACDPCVSATVIYQTDSRNTTILLKFLAVHTELHNVSICQLTR